MLLLRILVSLPEAGMDAMGVTPQMTELLH